MFKKSHLIIYDICNDKIRRKIVKILEMYGYRVQCSAFECCLNFKTRKLLISKIENIISANDSVRVYKLPSSVYIAGKGEEKFEKESEFILI